MTGAVEPIDGLASKARTALDDPAGVGLEPFERGAGSFATVDGDALRAARIYAVECLDTLIDTINPATQTAVNFARALRALGLVLAERQDEMRGILLDAVEPDSGRYREAVETLEDALDGIDSAIRSLEDPDLEGGPQA